MYGRSGKEEGIHRDWSGGMKAVRQKEEGIGGNQALEDERKKVVR